MNALDRTGRWVGIAIIALRLVSLPAQAQLGALGNQFLHQDSPGILDSAEEGDLLGWKLAVRSGDFNGNGFDDLAMGVPREDLGAVQDAGVVQVIYGALGGLSDVNQLWSQDSPGIADAAEEGDDFGWALAVGDFNDDGFDDLAIAGPYEDLTVTEVGVVHVLYGGPLGLSSTNSQFLHQDSPGILDSAEQGDHFGTSLSAGDFDNDGYDDLAIGVPGESVSGLASRDGAVHILYGSPGGLSDRDQFWSQESPGILDDAEIGDRFGASVQAGDLDGDGYDDLAVGVVWEDIDTVADAGAVQILYGGPLGLQSGGNQFWHQDDPGLPDSAEEDDNFGQILAIDDYNGDGYDDLAVGVPWEDLGALLGVGVVQILYGGPGGLDTAGNQLWSQDSPGLLDSGEQGDSFGSALSSGDFDHDGFKDLAVGVSGEDDLVDNGGAVQILYGSSGGLAAAGNQLWSQDSAGLNDSAETGDGFGEGLSVGDFDGGGFDDLAIGISGEDIRLVLDAGAVHILYSVGVFTDGFESGDVSAWSGSVP